MKVINDKPKKCGVMDGFSKPRLINNDGVAYYLGPALLSLWLICNGRRSLKDLMKLMSKNDNEMEYTHASIKEALDLLQTKKLIMYSR